MDEIFDNQLNRRSSNPDDTSGEVVYGGFRGKRDCASASESAMLSARLIDDSKQVNWIPSDKDKRREPTKRGARCVGETEPVRARKRARTPKRQVTDRAGTQLLVEDAISVISKLVRRRVLNQCTTRAHSLTLRIALTPVRNVCRSCTATACVTQSFPTARMPSWQIQTLRISQNLCTGVMCESVCQQTDG